MREKDDLLSSSAGGLGSLGAETKPLLQTLLKLKDKEITKSFIQSHVRVESLSQADFVLSLQCFEAVGEAEAAFDFYDAATSKRPELMGEAPLAMLLKAAKKDPVTALQGLNVYRDARRDQVRFPQLHGDSKLALSCLSLLTQSIQADKQIMDEAVGIKTMLQASGAKVDGAIYGSLMALAGKGRDYRAAKAFYEEAVEAGISPSIYMESALLTAAISANKRTDVVAIYKRIVSGEDLLMNAYCVQNMLAFCKRTQDIELALEVNSHWLEVGGESTWAICQEALAVFVSRGIIAEIASRDATIPVARRRPESEDESDSMDRQIAAIDRIMHKVLGTLKTADARRNAPGQKSFAQVMLDPYDQNSQIVPWRVVVILAPILALRGYAEWVFSRLEFSDVHTGSRQQTMVTMALRLGELGRWRELVSLSKRVEAYATTEGVGFHVVAMKVSALCVVALIRSNQIERANYHVVSSMLPLLDSLPSSASTTALEHIFDSNVDFKAKFLGILISHLTDDSRVGPDQRQRHMADDYTAWALDQCNSPAELYMCLEGINPSCAPRVLDSSALSNRLHDFDSHNKSTDRVRSLMKSLEKQ
eukprot:CAMPEP_0173181822 /NCGR_PEP_ID=MMETSP1141-20130122/7496_1 /TAXON_ID=483371 /ORGANISM="non described non described, Strain CCMP2298" /LENGTH=590 /DNA_ID=CAMNT_0014104849 /DNA_START=179 /DNA_END=1951 /DNA_ORIENTATION=-